MILKDEFKQICHILGSKHNLPLLFHNIFCKSFEKYPIPSFVVKVLTLNKPDELLNFLKINTPYLTPLSIELMQQVTEKVNSAKENFMCYKKHLFELEKEYILPLMKESVLLQYENFTKVIFKMRKCFVFEKYEVFYVQAYSLISFALNLKMIGVMAYDETEQMITCFIPDEFVDNAITNADNFSDRFDSANIESIKVDRHTSLQDMPKVKKYHGM